MGDVLRALFSSRKFVILVLTLLVLAPMVWLRQITVDKFVSVIEVLSTAIIAAIGVEGAAEKWNAPPPPETRKADSLKPPPKHPGDPPGVPPVATFAVSFALSLVAGLAGFFLVLLLPACQDAKSARNAERIVLDVEQTACVLLQAELGQSEPAVIAGLCKVPPALWEAVSDLFLAHRKARARYAALRAPDAGAAP